MSLHPYEPNKQGKAGWIIFLILCAVIVALHLLSI